MKSEKKKISKIFILPCFIMLYFLAEWYFLLFFYGRSEHIFLEKLQKTMNNKENKTVLVSDLVDVEWTDVCVISNEYILNFWRPWFPRNEKDITDNLRFGVYFVENEKLKIFYNFKHYNTILINKEKYRFSGDFKNNPCQKRENAYFSASEIENHKIKTIFLTSKRS
jgi:hypothetical protein